MSTAMHTLRTSTLRWLGALALVFLAACGGRPPTDAMEAARAAFEDSADAERCAEAEYRAARNLLEQAEAAYADRDYPRARQLADAAAQQAARARQLAAENAENCDRVQQATDEVTERRDTRDQGEPVVTDHEFVPIYFEYDASTIDATAQRILNGHAEQLVRNPSWRMQVEGHCDTRGSTNYNLALGDRRARAVKEYLVRMGVPPDQISTVSYGSEMPVASEHTRNRRAEFRVRR